MREVKGGGLHRRLSKAAAVGLAADLGWARTGKINTVTVPPQCLQHRGGRYLGWGGMNRSTRCSRRMSRLQLAWRKPYRDCAANPWAGRDAATATRSPPRPECGFCGSRCCRCSERSPDRPRCAGGSSLAARRARGSARGRSAPGHRCRPACSRPPTLPAGRPGRPSRAPSSRRTTWPGRLWPGPGGGIGTGPSWGASGGWQGR